MKAQILLIFIFILIHNANWAAEQNFAINFSTFALRPLKTENLYYQDASGTFTKMEFRKKSRSDLYEASLSIEEPYLRIYTRQALNNEGIQYQQTGQAFIPQGSTKWLLLLIQSPTNPEALQAYAIDDSSANFPEGSLRLANITGVETVGKINQNAVSIPNASISHAFSDDGRETLDISIAAKGSTRYHLLYKNTIRISSGSKGLLILTPPIRKGSIRIGGHLLLESPNEIKAGSRL